MDKSKITEIATTSIKNGTFLPLFFSALTLGRDKKGLELVRLIVRYKLMRKIRKQNKNLIDRFLREQPIHEKEPADKIWICWLQGIEQSPEIVQKCVSSVKKNIKGKEVILITKDNYSDFISFPDHIVKKYNEGIITHTHFSDLLRLELLTNYGGTWIDATVYVSSPDIPDYMLNSKLFVFQGLKPIDGHVMQISSWFMTSESHNDLLELTKFLLYEYWQTYNYMKDYFIFHLFFQLAIETFPNQWSLVFPASNTLPHILQLKLFDEFDSEWWSSLLAVTPIHKLTYKFDNEKTSIENTYYQKLMKE